MNVYQFQNALEQYGIKLLLEKSGSYDTILWLNRALTINNTYCHLFGYSGPTVVAGSCYTEIDKKYTELDIMDAVKKSIELYQNHIDGSVDHHDIFDYLETYGKTRIDKDSILRVRNIVFDNFNELHRSKKKQKL